MPSSRYISISSEANSVEPLDNMEAYTLDVDDVNETIHVRANSPAGAFYGVQSLLSLETADGSVVACSMEDYPRFPYRFMKKYQVHTERT